MIDYARIHDSDTSCVLRIALERRFDLAALRVLRRTLAVAGELRHLHPLRRFSADDDFGDDALFTDPDREHVGFAPSDR